METVMVSVGLMAVLMLSMAVGVIFSGRSLKGSCGGVGGGGDCLCEKQNDPTACSIKEDKALAGATSRPVADGVMVYEPQVLP